VRKALSTARVRIYTAQWHGNMNEIGKIQDETGALAVDQRIAIAQVHATLAIAQELSGLNLHNKVL
jgi:hypothetical protein